MTDPEVIMSPLCREISSDGTSIQVDIYSLEDRDGWQLEVIDETGASTVWDELFETDQAALDEVLTTIEKEGIRSFLEIKPEPLPRLH